jgi:hypothetical protein
MIPRKINKTDYDGVSVLKTIPFEKTNRPFPRLNCQKNQSRSFTPEPSENRISLQNIIVLNCFNIMETILASKSRIENEKFLQFYKTNPFTSSKRAPASSTHHPFMLEYDSKAILTSKRTCCE